MNWKELAIKYQCPMCQMTSGHECKNPESLRVSLMGPHPHRILAARMQYQIDQLKGVSDIYVQKDLVHIEERMKTKFTREHALKGLLPYYSYAMGVDADLLDELCRENGMSLISIQI